MRGRVEGVEEKPAVGGARPGRAFVGSRREGKNRSEAIDNEGALGLFRERRGMPGRGRQQRDPKSH